MNALKNLWHDDVGAVLSTEILIVVSILVLGIVPGLVAMRQGMISEMLDTANAILGLDQSYSFAGVKLIEGRHQSHALRDNRTPNAADAHGWRPVAGGYGSDDLGRRDDGRRQQRVIASSGGSAFVNRDSNDLTTGKVLRTRATSD